MKTYSAKASELEKKWILIDAEGLVVGRLASIIAMRLRGKHKPTYTPHMDCGDFVVVINAAKVLFTGQKLKKKIYYHHTGYIGGIKERSAGMILNGKFPERVLEKAVERMVPRGPLGRRQMANLRVYPGADHPHAAQTPEPFDVGVLNPKNSNFRKVKGSLIMADEKRNFGDLKTTLIKAKQPGAEDAAEAKADKRDSKGRAYATGRRKESVARVWIKPGSGKITVNGRDEKTYSARPVLRMILRQPLIAANRDGQFDIIATVNGGGLSGQAGAVRHGISRALIAYEPTLRPVLKPGGFLTRDPRAVERKKYGRPKARRSFQFSKR